MSAIASSRVQRREAPQAWARLSQEPDEPPVVLDALPRHLK